MNRTSFGGDVVRASCGRKRRYNSDAEANKQKARVGGTVYRCQVCRGWHITTGDSPVTMKKKFRNMMKRIGGRLT